MKDPWYAKLADCCLHPLGCFALTLLVIFGPLILAVWLEWASAGVQAGVYQRQGSDITQWEVFMGARPLDRRVKVEMQ